MNRGGKAAVALFDLDKTIYPEHSFFEVMRLLVSRGLINKDTEQQVRAEHQAHKEHKQDYGTTAGRLLVMMAAGLKDSNYIKVTQEVAGYIQDRRDSFFDYFGLVLPELR